MPEGRNSTACRRRTAGNRFFRPYGTYHDLERTYPAMNRWAIFKRPFGTEGRAAPEMTAGSKFSRNEPMRSALQLKVRSSVLRALRVSGETEITKRSHCAKLRQNASPTSIQKPETESYANHQPGQVSKITKRTHAPGHAGSKLSVQGSMPSKMRNEAIAGMAEDGNRELCKPHVHSILQNNYQTNPFTRFGRKGRQVGGHRLP
jgi:hypothetical protein